MNSEQKDNVSVKETEKSTGKEEVKKPDNEKKDEGLFKKFSIEVSKDEIEKNLEELASKYSSDMKLPGFRKGKIPVDVIKKRYKKLLNDEVLNRVVEQFVFKKIEEEKINIVSNPVVQKIDYKEGEDLKADIVVELFPEIELPDFEKIEISIPSKELKLAEYDENKHIDLLLEAHKRRAPIKNRNIQENDSLILNIQSRSFDTKRMTPQKEFSFMVKEEEEFDISDLHKDLIGKKKGDRITINRKYPKDFKKKPWAGKNMEHIIEIKNAFELVKPAFDEEFLKTLGFKEKEDFKKKLKEEYEQQQKNFREDKIIKAIVDKIIDVSDFPVPKTLVEREMLRLNPQNMDMSKMSDEKQRKDYLDTIRKDTEKSVKFSLIFETIKNQFKFSVENDELEKEYKKIADINKISLAEVRKYYSTPEQKQGLKESLLRIKVMDFLKEKIKIKEV